MAKKKPEEWEATNHSHRKFVFKTLDRARTAADAKHGRSGAADGPWLQDPSYGLTILVEEVGEVARAILENEPHRVEEELVDVAQVCVAWLESFHAAWGHEPSAEPTPPDVNGPATE